MSTDHASSQPLDIQTYNEELHSWFWQLSKKSDGLSQVTRQDELYSLEGKGFGFIAQYCLPEMTIYVTFTALLQE